MTQGLEAIPVRAPKLDEIDPEFVFKFNAATRLPDNVLESQGIEVLGEDERWTYFVLLDESARQHFADALVSFGGSVSEPTSAISAGLRRAIQSIDGIELYGPEDRLSPDLEQPQPDATVEAHIRLWPAGSLAEGEVRVDRVTQVVASSDGCEVLASTARPQTAAVVASVTAAGLARCCEIVGGGEDYATNVRPVSSTDIEAADPGDDHVPQGAPIGVLDDGPTLVNPLMAEVLAGSASFPDAALYPWNPPGGDGMVVASIAAFMTSKTMSVLGEVLRESKISDLCGLSDGTSSADEVRPPSPDSSGHHFHDSVEVRHRWLHSCGKFVS